MRETIKVRLVFIISIFAVKAPFKLKRKEGHPWMDQVFSYQIENSLIPPMGVVKIPVRSYDKKV